MLSRRSRRSWSRSQARSGRRWSRPWRAKSSDSRHPARKTVHQCLLPVPILVSPVCAQGSHQASCAVCAPGILAIAQGTPSAGAQRDRSVRWPKRQVRGFGLTLSLARQWQAAKPYRGLWDNIAQQSLVPGIHVFADSRQPRTCDGRETLVLAIRRRRIALSGHDGGAWGLAVARFRRCACAFSARSPRKSRRPRQSRW
jgi:hypothetical protein